MLQHNLSIPSATLLAMEIFKTRIFTDDGETFMRDSFCYEGTLWLVPKWKEIPDEGCKKPAYMIRIDGPLILVDDHVFEYKYVVSHPIPRSVFDGQIVDGYDIYTAPDIRFDLGIFR